jgi:hypothetical protein
MSSATFLRSLEISPVNLLVADNRIYHLRHLVYCLVNSFLLMTAIAPLLSAGFTTSSRGRMARGGHGLSKVSPGHAMPNSSRPCGQATPVTALRPFQGWPTRRAGGFWPSSNLLVTPRRTPTITSSLHFVSAEALCCTVGQNVAKMGLRMFQGWLARRV